jgi:hypothetical protein
MLERSRQSKEKSGDRNLKVAGQDGLNNRLAASFQATSSVNPMSMVSEISALSRRDSQNEQTDSCDMTRNLPANGLRKGFCHQRNVLKDCKPI